MAWREGTSTRTARRTTSIETERSRELKPTFLIVGGQGGTPLLSSRCRRVMGFQAPAGGSYGAGSQKQHLTMGRAAASDFDFGLQTGWKKREVHRFRQNSRNQQEPPRTITPAPAAYKAGHSVSVLIDFPNLDHTQNLG